jgi:hypothetical protein
MCGCQRINNFFRIEIFVCFMGMKGGFSLIFPCNCDFYYYSSENYQLCLIDL